MSVQPLDAHPLQVGARGLHRVLDSMPAAAWAGLDSGTARSTMAELARAKARLEAHLLAGARSLEESGAARKAGATSTGDLLGKDFGGDRGAGDRIVRTAKTLAKATRTERELRDGQLSLDQAKVIAEGLERLPATTTPEQKDTCERALIASAKKLNLRDLRRRTDRAVDAFSDKKKTDETENETLLGRERRARASSIFRMWDKRDGTFEGRFIIPEAQAEMLKTAIEAISAPRRTHLREAKAAGVTGNPTIFIREDELDTEHRLGQGFLELCNHLPTDKLPAAGGIGAMLTVNLDLDTLLEGIRAATLSTGTRISASQARKMACRLGIIPQVFDGRPLPLDLGANARVFSKAQRLTMVNRDGGCTFPGMGVPPQEAHSGGGGQAPAVV